MPRHPSSLSRPRGLPIVPIIGLAVLLLTTVLMVPSEAGRADAWPTQDESGSFNDEMPDFTYESSFSCDPDARSYIVLPQSVEEGEPDPIAIDPSQVEETDEAELTEVRFWLPDLEGGEWMFERRCNGERLDTRTFQYSQVQLTKVVDGEPDGPFVINVTCSDEFSKFGEQLPNVNREFGLDGGKDQVVFYAPPAEENPIDCEITEPDDGGADRIRFAPPPEGEDANSTVTFTDYSYGPAKVTNTFEPATEPSPDTPTPTPDPSPSPEPSPEPSPSPTEDVDDTVEEAEPAEPVETLPDFTG